VSSTKVNLYDTTLRDGAQREGLSFSVDDKLRITSRLDDFGIHYIEGGWPGANPKDIEYFEKARALELAQATVVAFGSTRHPKNKVTEDDNLKFLIDAGTKAVCLVGKTWGFHVEHALNTTVEENLKMIGESVGYLKEKGRIVFFDAEHFFDAYHYNPEYAVQALQAAEKAGADALVLCDTNGGALPSDISSVVRLVKNQCKAEIGIHAHNDGDCAVANSIVAVEAGATQIQGTINGYGERCGNANLISIIPGLALKRNIQCVTPEQLLLLTEISHFVSEVANVSPNTHQPYVGESAFAHKGGLHVSALARHNAYEYIDPALVGNVRRVLISELSGKSTVVMKAKDLGLDLTKEPEKVQDILNNVKQLEHIGYHFEAADASFEILIRKATGIYSSFFTLESFRVIMDRMAEGSVNTEATIKLGCKGKRYVETAEGNGPVNALDKALRMAIGRAYPEVNDIELTDYKVRVLDEKKGTGAVVRVLIDSTDGEKVWSTVGVSENIIEASWQALVDSVDYVLTHKKTGE
jgi:2-isopropylmalate synthase